MLTTSPLTCALSTSSCRQRLRLHDSKGRSGTGYSHRDAWQTASPRQFAGDDNPVQTSRTRAGQPDMTETGRRRGSRLRTHRPVPAASTASMIPPDIWPPLGRRVRPRRENARAALHNLMFPLQECGLRRARTLYPCPWQGCGQQLRQHSSLNLHIKRHMKERRFLCSRNACHQSFTTPCALVRHLRKKPQDIRGEASAGRWRQGTRLRRPATTPRQPQGSPPQTSRFPPASCGLHARYQLSDGIMAGLLVLSCLQPSPPLTGSVRCQFRLIRTLSPYRLHGTRTGPPGCACWTFLWARCRPLAHRSRNYKHSP